MNKPAIVGFVLMTLLVASVVTPAVSKQITIDKGSILESNLEQGEGNRLLGKLRMDVGREISNESVCYLKRLVYPNGRWCVKLIINYDCPSDRKIELDLHVNAELHDYDDPWWYSLEFFNINTDITIINGSNPPDIHKKVERYVGSHWIWGTSYDLRLHLRVTLKEYKIYDGEWLLNSEDKINIYVTDDLYFAGGPRARTYQNENKEFDLRVTNPFMKLIERFPNMFPMLRHLLGL